MTPVDYQNATEKNPLVDRAAASLRWTGSWYTVFVAVEPKGAGTLNQGLKQSLEKSVGAYRLAGQDLVFDSPVMGPFDNKWQLWRKKGQGPFAIAIRGTVEEGGSILEDLIAVMAKARGILGVGGANHNYQFAADPRAGVHLGFALATILLLNDPANGIIARAGNQIPTGSDIYITGHS